MTGEQRPYTSWMPIRILNRLASHHIHNRNRGGKDMENTDSCYKDEQLQEQDMKKKNLCG